MSQSFLSPISLKFSIVNPWANKYLIHTKILGQDSPLHKMVLEKVQMMFFSGWLTTIQQLYWITAAVKIAVNIG